MRVKSGLAEMLKGGVIMDVVNAEQAVIAENAGAVYVIYGSPSGLFAPAGSGGTA
jgi:pyridoxal biosynthesis lyase PdxS